MAKILQFPTPVKQSKCGHYRQWLLSIFHDHICGYCLIQHESLDIEHYIPKIYNSGLRHDSGNLLLACGKCNNHKWDYHPQYANRKSHAGATHAVLDVRFEDFASLMTIDSSGRLNAAGGPTFDRIDWNINELLKLNRPFLMQRRLELMRSLDTLYILCDAIQKEKNYRVRLMATTLFERIAPELLSKEMFFYCFGLPFPLFFQKNARLLYPIQKSKVIP